MRLFWQLIVFCTVLAWADSALSQRRPIADDTLGNERSIVTPQDDLGGVPGDRINGGARRGDNLFHSFREFGVDVGRSVYFNDPGVRNILSRVTGGNPSEIFGTLGVREGNANLFLINPSGILFGRGATLDVRGSFVGTTANAIQFGNQGFFNASEPNAPPLLTVQPSAFLFNQFNAAQITNYAGANTGVKDSAGTSIFGLRVPNGQSLLLVGGNVVLDRSARLNALSGHVEVAGISGIGTVGLSVDNNILRLTVPDGLARADVSLLDRSRIEVRGQGNGSIDITARNVEISGSGMIRAGITNGSTIIGEPGDININATNSVDLTGASTDGRSSIINITGSGTATQGGNILILTGSLSVTNGALIRVGAVEQGNPGDILINASDTVEFRGVQTIDTISTPLFRPTRITSQDGGGIQIRTGALLVRDGASLSASTQSQSNAGNILIEADTVEFSGFGFTREEKESALDEINSGAYSQVLGGAGQTDRVRGGDIMIHANSLSLTNSAVLSTNVSSGGQGNGGNITIDAERVRFAGENRAISEFPSSGIYSRVEARGIGNGGTVTLRAGSLELSDGGVIRTDFSGNEDGRAGNINIQADRLSLFSNASIESDTLGSGRAGDIDLNVTGALLLVGGETAPTGESTRITLGVEPGATGSGGNLSVYAGSLRLTDGAILKTSTQGLGNAGNIRVNANTVNISGSVLASGLPSGLFASTDTTARAGNIRIDSDRFRISNGAALSARTSGVGQGGNIRVNTGIFEALNGGQLVTTTSAEGQAGRIVVDADRVTLSGRDLNYFERIARFPNPIDPLVTNNITETGASSGLFANTLVNATGVGGDVRILAEQLTVRHGAQVTASSNGAGRAGDLEVKADEVTLNDRARLSANTDNENSRGGNVRLRISDSLSLTNDSEISASTQDGQGGRLTLNTDRNPTRLVELDSSQISTAATGTGDAGKLTLNTREVRLQEGSEISASTNTGNAGRLRINAEAIELSNQGRLAVEATGQNGEAGDLIVTTDQLTLNDADITVSSQEGLAGNLTITADTIALDQGNLTAETAANSEGEARANINLQDIDLLTMRNGSLISATATGNANGGNVTISAPGGFAVASPNQDNDITASAPVGLGGNVQITTQGIFGLEERPASPGNGTNDIAATGGSPELSGTVELNTPDVDPSRGLTELPIAPVDVSNQIAQSCPTNGDVAGAVGSFVATGRGGIPANPAEILGGETVLTDLAEIEGEAAEGQENNEAKDKEEPDRVSATTQAEIIEAQGWVVGANGKVMLTAENPTGEPHRPAIAPILCPKS
jgi:filamentous hemagglutinin family protein